MRKIILNLAVSLDGFIEGPNGEIDWCIIDDEPASASDSSSHFDRFLSDIDTIFYGRVSYDLWGEYQPDAKASLPEKKLWEGVHSKKNMFFRITRKKQMTKQFILTLTSSIPFGRLETNLEKTSGFMEELT